VGEIANRTKYEETLVNSYSSLSAEQAENLTGDERLYYSASKGDDVAVLAVNEIFAAQEYARKASEEGDVEGVNTAHILAQSVRSQFGYTANADGTGVAEYTNPTAYNNLVTNVENVGVYTEGYKTYSEESITAMYNGEETDINEIIRQRAEEGDEYAERMLNQLNENSEMWKTLNGEKEKSDELYQKILHIQSQALRDEFAEYVNSAVDTAVDATATVVGAFTSDILGTFTNLTNVISERVTQISVDNVIDTAFSGNAQAYYETIQNKIAAGDEFDKVKEAKYFLEHLSDYEVNIGTVEERQNMAIAQAGIL
jgi:hypothetical protein